MTISSTRFEHRILIDPDGPIEFLDGLDQYRDPFKLDLALKRMIEHLENLNKSNQAIEFYVKKNIKENTKIINKKKSVIINNNFFDQPNEIVFRSISQLIHELGNKTNYTRGKKILNLINIIKLITRIKLLNYISDCN